ncbi:MAG TPA: hypothetical protein VHD15_08840 [Hyphomicrobiales bacterium]|nr:hypothetical protein [Hyphomicrobiales bacterium]
MAWNLCYDHLLRWAINEPNRVDALNVAIRSKFPKKNLVITKREETDELKESEFIEAARISKLIDKNTPQIIKEKPARRNMAAHPSQISIIQHQLMT